MQIVTNWKFPLAVLATGMALSMLTCSYVREWEETSYYKEIVFRSETQMVAFKGAIRTAVESGNHIRAAVQNELFYNPQGEFGQERFAALVEDYLNEEEKTGIRNISWIPKSGRPDGKGYRYLVRYSLYDSAFDIKPGVDAASINTHREHILQAAESGEHAVDMHLDRDSHRIISIFVPLYQPGDRKGIELGEDRLAGIVYLEWDVGEVLEATQFKLPVSDLDFYLYEVGHEGSMELIFASESRSGRGMKQPDRESVWKESFWVDSFWVAEHLWQLSSVPSPEFARAHPVVLAWMVIIFGTLLSFSAAYYVWRVSIQKSLVEREVQLRTAELKRSRESLEESQKIAHMGSWEWNITTDAILWSDETFRIFGYAPQAFRPTFESFVRAIVPEDLERVTTAIDDALEGGDYTIVHRIALQDGAVRVVREQGRVDYGSEGYPMRMVGTIQDITEQHRAERLTHRLAMALAGTAESVVITNRDGVIRYVNRSFEKMSGYRAEEAIGKTPNLVKSGQHSDEYYRVMWEQVSGGQPWLGMFTNKNKNGKLYEVEQTISPIRDEHGDINGYVAVQRDVTGERERRKKMEHTQRLESLGLLAGGIAHDFNNLLTAIMGNASLARIAEDVQEMNNYMKRIERASEHASELCRQMLAYSGQGESVRESFNLSERIHDMTELLQVSLNKNASLSMDLGPCNCLIHGDKSQIQQVIMNLVINASEAIEETGRRGEIRLSVGLRDMHEKDFENCLHQEGNVPPSGNYCYLTVSDNGCGMDDETRMKVFDPFFTTKFTGRGLGTSAMLGIVQAHGGALYLETARGEGTTFTVYLPCEPYEKCGAVEAPIEAGHREPSQAPGKTILLIDDEVYVLDVMNSMLDIGGYRILRAENATQGIDIFSRHAGEISLVILDMTMPEIDGISCAAQLLEIDPQARIVLSSGYNKEVLKGHIKDLKFAAFLQKPFSRKELTGVVDGLLK